jgi:hypothetical protein
MRGITSWISRRTRRTAVSGVVALGAVAAVLTGATTQPADASAGSCALFGTSVFCTEISGNGQTVTNEGGRVATVRIENSQEIIRFYDLHNSNYRTLDGPVHVGEAYGNLYWWFAKPFTARVGRACGTLYSDGRAIVTTCVSIS